MPDAPIDFGFHLDAARMQTHVAALAAASAGRNIWNYESLQRAAEYIERELTGYGYAPRRQTFEVARVPVSNIEASRQGISRGREIILLGAHYDSVTGCPGANDNATGVAALLELSGRFASRPLARTVRFVAFVNEEPPFFRTPQMGSVVYASAARAHGDRIVAMISLETMGYYSDEEGSQQYPTSVAPFYPKKGNFIAFVSNLRSAGLLMKARRGFKARTSFPLQTGAIPGAIPGVGWSDHWSFWQAGYAAMMVTDTALFRYPWYHTAGDTPDRIDPARLAHVVDGLEHVVRVLAGEP